MTTVLSSGVSMDEMTASCDLRADCESADVTRSMLLEVAWTYDFEPRGNIVDMHIHRLRHKVDEGFTHRLIHTVPGAGYMLREPDKAAVRPEPSA